MLIVHCSPPSLVLKSEVSKTLGGGKMAGKKGGEKMAEKSIDVSLCAVYFD